MNETAQKILGYIKRLPETWDFKPLRQQALDNFDENYTLDMIHLEITNKNFISYSFDWTYNYDEYWYNIDKLLRNGTIQLLPEEKKDDVSDTSTWSFETNQEFYEFCMNKKGTGYYLDGAIEEFVASKQRKPLFTTEDWKQIFEGDTVISVYHDYQSQAIQWNKRLVKVEGAKYFSTEAAAREYVRLNKPMYSLEDVKVSSYKIDLPVYDLKRLITELEKLKP